MVNAMRDRVREKMRVELAEQMYPLFADEGVDNVTAEQAAREAGISRATFFRYFASKEDAVTTAIRSLGPDFADVLSSLESRPGESLLELLRRCFESSVKSAERSPEEARIRARTVLATPALRSSWAARRQEQQTGLAQALCAHCPNPRLADTAAVIALALYDHALARWLETPDQRLRDLLDEAFDYAVLLDLPG